MEIISELMKQLNESNKDWEKYLNDEYYMKRMANDAYADKTKELLERLIDEICKKQLILLDQNKDEQQLWNELLAMGVEKTTCDLLKKRNRPFVSRYQNFKPMRLLGGKIVVLLVDIFDHICTSYDPKFLLQHEKYKIDDEGEFIKAVLQLDQLVSRQIERHYDKKTAQLEFVSCTGVDEIYGLVYGELFEKNMQKIQANIILDKLESVIRKVDILADKINSKIK